ncbi:2OG-Fe(II) oxygenase [Variovorax terrae]|uniref:2OG-Fe(II) oxygenase n=1 Tax=Variovorax terrae TaxID=2923278 RepID=A0A9X1VWI6_9BURK|nr:2OG-Fe(II) oxygenase [Variovorax terrae]MCJ0764503.1 2OG-Fe(II) oxygenase [Variovorax terrae]
MQYEFIEPRFPPCSEEAGKSPLCLSPQVQTYSVLNEAECHVLAAVITQAHETGQSWASRTRYAAGAQWNVNQQFRSSKNLPPELAGLSLAFEAMHTRVQEDLSALGLNPRRHSLKLVERQCLVYQKGDHIGDHADDSALVPAKDSGMPQWHVVKPERQIAGILWLTSQASTAERPHEFAGGTFRFNSLVNRESKLPLDIAPKAGAMVIFPANPWFRHEVLPVLAGTRIALACWWQVLPLAEERIEGVS